MSYRVISKAYIKVVLVLVVVLLAGIAVLISGEQAVVVGDEKEGVTVSDVEDYEYDLTPDGAIITGYTVWDDTEIEIPAEIEGEPVVKLGEAAFEREGLEEVTVPDSVEEIGASAFRDNSLTEVTIPDSVREIGDFAFYRNDLTEVIIGDSVEEIGDSAFQHNSLTEVTIPDSVEEIRDRSFSRNNLTEVIIEDGVVEIGNNAFQSNDLSKVTIPDSVLEIGNNAFQFNNLSKVTIPDSVVEIGNSAFANNDLTEVIISDSLEVIQQYVFNNNNLSEVTIPDSVETIESSAFRDNNFDSFEEDVHFVVPENIKSLAGFDGRYGWSLDRDFLSKFENLEEIGDSAFRHNSLTELTIPDSVVEIGENSFSGNAFDSFEEDVHFEAPENIKSLSGFNDYGAGFIEDKKFLTKFENLKKIGKTAFHGNALTEVTIPDSVKVIGDNAFGGFRCNNNLTEVTIPESLEEIGERAFHGNALTEVTIPDSVKVIGGYAFSDNAFDSFEDDVHFEAPENIKSLAGFSFYDEGFIEEREFLSKFENLERIGNHAFYSNDLAEVTIPDSVVEIGDSAFAFNELTEVTIPDSMVKLGSSAFQENALTEITIPDSVEEIGSSAFKENALTKANIGDSVEKIGDEAFFYNELTEVTIPDSVREIGYLTFARNKLTEVIIGENVEKIVRGAFAYNELTEVIIPESVKVIETQFDYSGSFQSNSLTEVTIGDNVKEIGYNVFRNNSLTEVTFPESMEVIESNAFKNNYLAKITIPEGVLIAEDAFDENYGDFVADYENMDKQAGTYEYCEETDVWELTEEHVFIETKRLAGLGRFATAVDISENIYEDGEAEAVVLATGLDFPDALAGASLAYAKHGPLLLTGSDELPEETADEIDRLLNEGDAVYVLGGEAAVSEKVAGELDAKGYEVERLAGEGRFDTAVKIAEEVANKPAEVFLTTGLEFADAVATSGPAAMKGAPILLTRPDKLSADTEGYLEDNEKSIEDIHVIGGEAAVSDEVMENAGGTNRISGADRWETGTAIAEEFFEDPEKATLATGLEFPDALAGGVYAALNGVPVLLTNVDELPDELENYFREEEALSEVTVFGGVGAIDDKVLEAIEVIE